MSEESNPLSSVLAAYRAGGLQWKQLLGSPRFDFPIDYSIAVLAVDESAQRVDFASKWAPDSYCHFHRHLGPTSLVVVEGEHHVVERSATETVHKIRRPGHTARNPGGDVHMEYGGPAGTVVLFSMSALDGKMFDVLDTDHRVLRTVTFKEFASGDY